MLTKIKGYLETSLNMGFFDVSDDIPVELFLKDKEAKNKEAKNKKAKNKEAKNKEIDALKQYIVDNKKKLSNAIFVL